MGGDGGSIPGRADVVRTRGYEFLRNLGGMGYTPNTVVKSDGERVSRLHERDLRLKTCSLSQDPLQHPIVVDRKGNLYNKEEVVRRLLSKQECHGIRRLRDVQEIARGCFLPEEGSLFCPLTSSEVTPAVRAVVVWRCGCVVRLPMFTEIFQANNNQCPRCGEPVTFCCEVAPKEWL
ncbi:MAG: uncharacterized protein KVP18_002708 [Porospora cf. gigantea A]|uniref:uncharacterized protein n=1 Tax=Porospora cf. gigantea A TaxID=2853593 RepID=UPI00355A4FBF|nr:MAG: hypothetical protein KVP18_002708 [Porospora cf. gigantea A]